MSRLNGNTSKIHQEPIQIISFCFTVFVSFFLKPSCLEIVGLSAIPDLNGSLVRHGQIPLSFYHCLKCMCSPRPHGCVWKLGWSSGHFAEKTVMHNPIPLISNTMSWSQWNVEIPDKKEHGFVERGCLIWTGDGITWTQAGWAVGIPWIQDPKSPAAIRKSVTWRFWRSVPGCFFRISRVGPTSGNTVGTP